MKSAAITSVSPGNRGLLKSGLTCLLRILLLLVFCSLLLPLSARPIPIDDDIDEVSVSLTVSDVGTTELSSIVKDKTIYLSASGIFNFLKIKNTASAELDSLSGSFIHPDSTFLIDKQNNLIRYRKHIYHLQPGDIIVTKTNLYLRSEYFSKVFGLNCQFNFRALSVVLTTKKELPILRELKLAKMRENIQLMKGIQRTDTTLKRQGKLFNAGMVDWSLYGIKTQGQATDLRGTLGLGAVVAGGETSVLLNYHNQEKFRENEQFYSWRYANNDNTSVRQVLLGKIIGPSISSIYGPIVGAQVTNSPTTNRRAFDGYQYTGFTEPNWLVELYVNGELVNYKKADPAGFYTFNVPLVYGNSVVRLRFYGPFGEEKTKEISINIPFNFLPVKEFEYSASAGMVEDSLRSKYSRFAVNYGLNSLMTVGGGLEYLSSVKTGPTIPFLNASARLAPGLLFSGDYAYNVRTKALLTYRLPSNAQIEAEYTHYVPGQTAINLNYLQDRRISFSMPYQFHPFSVYTRVSFDRIDVPTSHYSNADWLLTVSGRYISANITTYALLYSGIQPYVFSNYALTFRLPSGLMFTPQVQYEYREKDIVSVRADLERKILNHGYMNLRYERNFKTGYNNAMVSFRYEFGFGVVSTNLSRSNGKTSVEQSAASSLVLQRNEPVILSKNMNVGRGGVRFVCYLDLNGNGKRDAGEPKITGLKIRVSGGQIVYNKRDSSVVSYQMEAYTNYTVWLDQDDFQNIAWSLKIHSMTVYIEPNQIRMVEIPITVKAEASGKVVSLVNGELAGQERMIVDIVNSDNLIISKNLTEADGTFSYMGLKPGSYRVMLDAAQLKHLKLRSIPAFIPLTVKINKDGAFIDSLLLTVQSLVEPEKRPVNKPASSLIGTENNPAELASDITTENASAGKTRIKTKRSVKVIQAPADKTINQDQAAASIRTITGAEPEVNKTIIREETTTGNRSISGANTTAGNRTISVTGSITGNKIIIGNEEAVKLESPFVVQTVSFGNYRIALAAQARISRILNKQVNILIQAGYYKLRIVGMETRSEADLVRSELKKLGYYGLILNRPAD